ncbi:uncharacterized protein LOC144598704 isoform X2 [Rhinoraja longicauda]
MTTDNKSGQTRWCLVDFYLLRKQGQNNSKEKSSKQREADVSLEQSDTLCEADVSQAQSDKLYEIDVSQGLSTNLSGQADHTSDFEEYSETTSKLQTSVSMGEMNVGDKYEMDVDMLATSNSSLGKQIVVKCVGKNKDNPLITFTPTLKIQIGSLPLNHDCSGDFPTSQVSAHSSKPYSNNDNLNMAPSPMWQPLCLPSSTEPYQHKFKDDWCEVINLEETTSSYVNQSPIENHDDSSGLSDTTLIDIYPGMVASMSDLLDRTYKTEAASRLIKHYRHLQFNTNKSKRNTIQNGTQIKAWMDARKLKRLKYHSVIEVKAHARGRDKQNKAISPKSNKPLQYNLETTFTLIADAASRTVPQINSKSDGQCFAFGSLNNDLASFQPLPVSPCSPKIPTAIASPVFNGTPLNGSTSPQQHRVTNSNNLKSLSSKSDMAGVELLSPRIIVNHLRHAEQSPLSSSAVTRPNDPVMTCNSSPFRMLLRLDNSKRNKRRHSISASVPAKFHSVQSLFKSKGKGINSFESVYQSLVCNSFCLPSTLGHHSGLNVHATPRRTITSVSSDTYSPSPLSRKRAACSDQARESSRWPLKRFRSFPDSSSSPQSSSEMLMLNTILQRQDYHCAHNGFYSPRSKQKNAADMFIKCEDDRLYSHSATVLPVINSSGITVSLSLSPRFRSRVSRKLEYNKVNTSTNYYDLMKQNPYNVP